MDLGVQQVATSGTNGVDEGPLLFLQIWLLRSGLPQDGLQLEFEFPDGKRKIAAFHDPLGFAVEVSATVCGENILVVRKG